MFSIFIPFIVDNSYIRRQVHNLVAEQPGLIRFEAGDQWVKDFSLGCMAYFANEALALEAERTIRNTMIGSKKRGFDMITKVYINGVYDVSDADRFDAAVIAYRHTPSASNYCRLEAAMLKYQSSHAINAEFTQR